MRTFKDIKPGDKLYLVDMETFKIEQTTLKGIDEDQYGNVIISINTDYWDEFYTCYPDWKDWESIDNEMYRLFTDLERAVKITNRYAYDHIFKIHENIEHNNNLFNNEKDL